MPEKKILERELEAHFSRQCKKLGLMTLKIQQRMGRGYPDRMVMLPLNRVAWAELKTLTGKLSPRQTLVHKQLHEAGHQVEVLRTKESITTFLTDISRGK